MFFNNIYTKIYKYTIMYIYIIVITTAYASNASVETLSTEPMQNMRVSGNAMLYNLGRGGASKNYCPPF